MNQEPGRFTTFENLKKKKNEVSIRVFTTMHPSASVEWGKALFVMLVVAVGWLVMCTNLVAALRRAWAVVARLWAVRAQIHRAAEMLADELLKPARRVSHPKH